MISLLEADLEFKIPVYQHIVVPRENIAELKAELLN